MEYTKSPVTENICAEVRYMATSSANIGFEKQIWDAACVLWGHIPAADYRKVIVGLIFLSYIGNAFEKR